MLKMLRTYPIDIHQAHLQGISKFIKKVAELPWGAARRVFLRHISDTLKETHRRKEIVGSTRSASRLSDLSFCLPAVRDCISAIGKGSGGGGLATTGQPRDQPAINPVCELSYINPRKS